MLQAQSSQTQTKLQGGGGGWRDFGKEGSIYAGNGGSLLVERAIFKNNSTHNAGTTIQSENSDVTISESLFLNNYSSTFGGAAVFSDHGSLAIKHSTFYKNISGSEGDQGSGGAVYVQNNDSVKIISSYFQENSASRTNQNSSGGAMAIHSVENLFILNSTFDSNSSDYYGGALSITYTDNTIIQDASFIGNTSGQLGAGIAFLNKPDSKNFITAKNSDVLFSGNTLSGEDPAGEDVFINYADTVLNLNAFQGRTIRFDGTVTSSTSPREDGPERLGEIHINKAEGALSLDDDGGLVDAHADDALTGTIVFNDEVENVDLHLHGGTLWLKGENTENGVLSTSVLHLDAAASTISLLDGKSRSIRMAGLSGDGHADLYLDVDLENASSDSLALVDGAEVQGSAAMGINGWNVISDARQSVVVVSVADEELKDKISLNDSAGTALGSIYTYDVSRLENGDYQFQRVGGDPSSLNPDVYAGDVAAAGIGVLDHLINSSMLSRRLSGEFYDASDDGANWWASLAAEDASMRTGNFHGVDYLYAAGILGYTTDQLNQGEFKSSFTFYGAFVDGSHDYASNEIKQNAAVLGASADISRGDAWISMHAKAGLMNSRLKLSASNPEVNVPWAGFNISGGMKFSNDWFTFNPYVMGSFVYVSADDYRTSEDVSVDLDSAQIFELAPGFSIAKAIPGGLEAQLSARYNFVKVYGSHTRADEMNLPEIHYDNYAEYGLGLVKQSQAWRAAFRVERSSDGRQGWTGFAHLDWIF